MLFHLNGIYFAKGSSFVCVGNCDMRFLYFADGLGQIQTQAIMMVKDWLGVTDQILS